MAPLLRQSGSAPAHLFRFIIGSLPLPLVTSQARLESDVLEPQPGVTAGFRRMFQALGVPDRYPAIPSVSRYSVRLCVRAPLVELLGYTSAAQLLPTRCELAVGNRFLSGFGYFGLITLASQGFRVPSCGSSGEPAVYAQFWLRLCRMVLRPHLYCLPSQFTCREVPLLFFLGLCGIWSCVCHIAFAMITLTFPAQVLPAALCSVAVVAVFSPIPRF